MNAGETIVLHQDTALTHMLDVSGTIWTLTLPYYVIINTNISMNTGTLNLNITININNFGRAVTSFGYR